MCVSGVTSFFLRRYLSTMTDGNGQQQTGIMPRRHWRRVARRASAHREDSIDYEEEENEVWSPSPDFHNFHKTPRSLTPPPLYDSCLPPSYENAVGTDQTTTDHTTNDAVDETKTDEINSLQGVEKGTRENGSTCSVSI